MHNVDTCVNAPRLCILRKLSTALSNTVHQLVTLCHHAKPIRLNKNLVPAKRCGIHTIRGDGMLFPAPALALHRGTDVQELHSRLGVQLLRRVLIGEVAHRNLQLVEVRAGVDPLHFYGRVSKQIHPGGFVDLGGA